MGGARAHGFPRGAPVVATSGLGPLPGAASRAGLPLEATNLRLQEKVVALRENLRSKQQELCNLRSIEQGPATTPSVHERGGPDSLHAASLMASEYEAGPIAEIG